VARQRSKSFDPNLRRELIRLANRRDYNATEVAALVEYAEYMTGMITTEHAETLTAEDFLEVWEESFDDDLEP
jgi:hypothetical protein